MAELQKTISVKLYAMDLCQQVLNEWIKCNSLGFPVYDVKVLTNRQINEMSHEEVMEHTSEARKAIV